MTTALAAADQQLQLADDSLADLTDRAKMLLERFGRTSAWSLLSRYIASQLDLDSKHQSFAADVLAAAVMRLATESSAGSVEAASPESSGM
ncbi:hypothetical protein [Actinoplanes sp. NPDC051851]|uniref:hypothetical protein n=1 Tax=Actinoplanes sp. NPDC051851 TaxID=3154753 RepID=UPI00341D2020